MIPHAARILTLALGALAAAGAVAQTYTVTDLGSLGAYESFAFAVNDSTRVTGFSWITPSYDRHAFLWQKGQMQDLGTLPGGTYSWGFDINEAGHVCGLADDANIYGRPVLYRNGVLQDLGLPEPRGGEARGINNLTEIAGYLVTDTSAIQAFYWSDATSFVNLTTQTLGSQGMAEDLNDHTQVVGWSHSVPCGGFTGPRATLWEDPGTGWTATDLGTLGSLCYSYANDINEMSQVVGESSSFAAGSPVLWKKTSLGAWQIQNLGSLGGSFGRAHALNNRGQIVGESQISGGSYRAFLWQCNAIVDLNTRIPSGSGWVLHAATGVNDLGEIVGYGKLNGGDYHGFLLKPAATATKCCVGSIAMEP